jgi:uncharacterized protein YlzI (FlbEa/FlbD family)
MIEVYRITGKGFKLLEDIEDSPDVTGKNLESFLPFYVVLSSVRDTNEFPDRSEHFSEVIQFLLRFKYVQRDKEYV